MVAALSSEHIKNTSSRSSTESMSPTNFKLGRRLEHALSNAKPMASYKLRPVDLGYCTRAGTYRVVWAHRAATQLVIYDKPVSVND